MSLVRIACADTAFASGTVEEEGAPLRYERVEIGTLTLAGNSFWQRLLGLSRVNACDGFVTALNQGPLIDHVPAGDFPVSIAIAHLATGEKYIAFLRVEFTDSPRLGWRPALSEAEASDVRIGGRAGYGVDSGTGSLMGMQAARHLARRLSDDADKFESEVIDAMRANYRKTSAMWAIARPSAESRENAVFVQSGFGDGCYASYFGTGKHDHFTCLLTDFGVSNRVSIPGRENLDRLMKMAPQLIARQKEREAAAKREAPPPAD